MTRSYLYPEPVRQWLLGLHNVRPLGPNVRSLKPNVRSLEIYVRSLEEPTRHPEETGPTPDLADDLKADRTSNAPGYPSPAFRVPPGQFAPHKPASQVQACL